MFGSAQAQMRTFGASEASDVAASHPLTADACSRDVEASHPLTADASSRDVAAQ